MAAIAPWVRPGIHGERHVGRAEILARSLMNRVRQALPAIFTRHGQSHPAAFAIGVEGCLEALRRRYRTVGVAMATFKIALAVSRLIDFFGDAGGLAQYRLQHVAGRVGKARQVRIALKAKHIVEDKKRIFYRGLVGRHAILQMVCRFMIGLRFSSSATPFTGGSGNCSRRQPSSAGP
jgi:hypothetical protein